MSKINALIQELQLKQKKIDYLNYIKDLLKGDQHCVDYVEVQDEVLSKVIPQLDALSKEIEDGTQAALPLIMPVTGFSPDQILILSKLADKVKPLAIENVNPEIPKTPPVKKPVMSTTDKISFAMDNRYLSNKEVKVSNDQGIEVKGKVVGLDAPFVIVKTNQGPTISVPLEKVQLTQ